MAFSSDISGSLSTRLRFWKYKLKICIRTAEVCVVVMITYTVRVKYISHNSYNGMAKFMNGCLNLFLQKKKQRPHACTRINSYLLFDFLDSLFIYLLNKNNDLNPLLIKLTLTVILAASLWNKHHHTQSIQSIIHQVKSTTENNPSHGMLGKHWRHS